MNIPPAGTGTLVNIPLKSTVTYDLRSPSLPANSHQQEPDAHTQPLIDMVDHFVRETPVFKEGGIPGQRQKVHFDRPLSFRAVPNWSSRKDPNWENNLLVNVTTTQSFLFTPELLKQQKHAALQPIQQYLTAIHQAGRQVQKEQEKNGIFQFFV
jgi:hypothetical protein